MSDEATIQDIRKRLTEVGGRTAQDLGLGRVVGQILVHLYLRQTECSLDDLARDLGLSKAAISIAARQLESLGLLRHSWRPGDRKTYYRTADDIGTALHQGLLMLIRNKMALLAAELQVAEAQLGQSDGNSEAKFVLGRVRRAQKLRDTAMAVLENPMVKFLTKVK
jgi:DNA-binding transcriptional regulator GbsR (MarR family)